jgi:hypothetical protein
MKGGIGMFEMEDLMTGQIAITATMCRIGGCVQTNMCASTSYTWTNG